MATGVIAPVGLALAPAVGRAWKMLFAPPRMLTRSVAPKRPPAAVYWLSWVRMPGPGVARVSVREPP